MPALPAFSAPPVDLAPIPFDGEAAAAAIAACEAVAAAVDTAAEARASAATTARTEWRGPARDDFDDELLAVQRTAADLAADLLATAGAIRRAWDATVAENAAREREREAWERSQPEG